MKNNNKFRFSAILWHELGLEKATSFINIFEENICRKLTLKKYGNGLDHIGFIFIIDRAKTMHKASRSYKKKSASLLIKRTVNYENALQANQTEYLQLLAQTFLAATKEMRKWKIMDFDAENFAIDVENALVDLAYIQKT